jgi:hypothetical protein
MRINITTIQYLLMKYLATVFLFFLFVQLLTAQSVTITVDPEHSGNNLSSYPIKHGTLAYSDNQFLFGGLQIIEPAAWSISPAKNKIAFLQKREMLYLRSFDYSGRLLVDKALEFFDPDDATLDVYQYNDGRVVVRDNVANFSFFDARGGQVFSVSNFAQSHDGERESRLSSDISGRTTVLYNPAIAYGSATGSRAQLLYGEDQTEPFFRDDNREIKSLAISDNGTFITIITANGNHDRVIIFDRFGNELIVLDMDGEITGAVTSSNGEYVTTFRDARMQVFSVSDGELLGSASSRNNIITAAYFPDDELLVSLNGSVNHNRITNSSVTAVHITKRQITSENIKMQLSLLQAGNIDIVRTGTNQYRLTGLNRELLLNARF